MENKSRPKRPPAEVSDTAEPSGDKSRTHSRRLLSEDERIKIGMALDNAKKDFIHERKPGQKADEPSINRLPAYMEEALLKYHPSISRRITEQLLAPKLVKRAHDKGKPLSRVSRVGSTAFEEAAKQLEGSNSTVERDYYNFPPDPDDDALDFSRKAKHKK